MADKNIVRLSTRDKNLRNALMLTDKELAEDILNSQKEHSVKELLREIERTKNPAAKEVLQNEYARVMRTAEMIDEMNAYPVAMPPTKTPNLLDRILTFFSKESK